MPRSARKTVGHVSIIEKYGLRATTLEYIIKYNFSECFKEGGMKIVFYPYKG
jgi:hypothetical protein